MDISPHSRTYGTIDLRLTRPPETLKPIPFLSPSSPSHISERPKTTERNYEKENNNLIENDKIINKRKKQKIQKIKQETVNLFEDLSPEAQRRLNAMLRNFCLEENGELKTEIDLEQYAIDAGEVITNATVQELCIIQPNLVTLNLKGCDLVSDVGLWTIARHCPNIKILILSSCNKITNVGLRSLSMRCSELITLDFTSCTLLDDIGLSTIACGCWKLENLIMIDCPNITDTGVGKVVKSCQRLQTLNLLNCHRVGEFGDHALKEIGAFCSDLRYLNLIGCKHVHNQGIIALSQGCQLLEILSLSNCDGVTANGLIALCKYLSHLHTLILRDCTSLSDNDMSIFQYSAFQSILTSLDISNCKAITNQGVRTLSESLGTSLRVLNLSGCPKITDHLMRDISLNCEKLNELDLSHCKFLSDQTVHTVVSGITGLTTLKLDGNSKITSKTLLSYLTGVNKLEFANMSQQWYGYEPKKNAIELILAKELHRVQTLNVIKIQCMVRCHQAYQRYLAKRRIWLVNKFIPRFQALFRGRRERKKYALYKLQLLRNHMALKIQRRWRRYLQVVKHYLAQRRARIHQLKINSARLVQRIFWGFKGKKRAIERRNEIMNERLEAAKLQAMKETKATQIQCCWHIFCAKKLMKLKKVQVRKQKIIDALRDRMARIIQRLERGRKGRKKARYMRFLAAKKALMWSKAREIQRVYRGHVGRLIAQREREERWRRICWSKAIVIQCFWRTMRAKMIVAILRALEILRQKQFFNAREIQRVYRGMRVRMKMEQLRAELMEKLKRVLASIQIQRIFRGHKGREIAEVERALKLSEIKAKPLYNLLRDLEEDGIKLTKQSTKLEGMIIHTEKEIGEITRELDHATKTTSKFTDSSRVNGIPQRFLTKYLVVRLQDNLSNEQELLKKHIAAHIETKSNLRAIDRKIRAAKRELIPLTTGLILKTKNERFQRLRNRVRLIRKSVIRIQSLWRRAIVRKTYRDPNRDYWVQCYDEEQGPEPYYYNTWTLETVWKAPFAYRYFVSHYKKKESFIGQQYGGSGEKESDWIEIEDNGELYNYNIKTKEYVLKK